MQRKNDKKTKVTNAQIDVLCTFFEENPELVLGYKKTPKNFKAVFVKWQKITPHLNSLGVQKDPSQWAKYLRNHRANLKHRNFKWKQNRNGSGPIICNADDFSEIAFRMLQVFRKGKSKPHGSQNSNVSCFNSESDVKAEPNSELETIVIKEELERDSDLNDVDRNELTQSIPMGTQIFLSSNEETPQAFVNASNVTDEFDIFARNMAQQLRALPIDIALETQEIMWSVIFKQRLKVVNDVGDPLEKKNS
ncbi:uncharacterized protein [Choristoneura fumiferana]|uniref:uncharacterized protein n=1 Tax=Choristoneura fumiferana TaxID=7141 RepID=UPI003D15BE35